MYNLVHETDVFFTSRGIPSIAWEVYCDCSDHHGELPSESESLDLMSIIKSALHPYYTVYMQVIINVSMTAETTAIIVIPIIAVQSLQCSRFQDHLGCPNSLQSRE